MEVTLEITDYCPHECHYCSTNASKVRKYIVGKNEIKAFLDRVLSEGNTIDRINISGGEPLSHPDFYNILVMCEEYTPNVWVYTNALRQIIYNSDVITEIGVEANVCLTPGEMVYIPEKADKVHLLQLISQGRAKDMKPANIHVSSNISNPEKCKECNHVLLQANRRIVSAPCKKDY
jgi:molybdenum cofactor biosynthesis enzyme MoaA